jgi:hypothetical protein
MTERTTRLGRAIDRLEFRMYEWSGTLFIAAGSLVGFETLALLLSYLTMSPVAIPLMIAAVGVFAVVRSRIRGARRTATLRVPVADSTRDCRRPRVRRVAAWRPRARSRRGTRPGRPAASPAWP